MYAHASIRSAEVTISFPEARDPFGQRQGSLPFPLDKATRTLGTRLARSPWKRLRNELTERDWENAVQGLGKVPPIISCTPSQSKYPCPRRPT